jgi:anti-anti-sigma factor
MAVSSVLSSDGGVGTPDSAPLVSREGDRIVVWLDGECDIATAFVLDEALTKAISDDRADVIVDLSGVTFIGTVTIDALIKFRNTLRRQFRSLTVRSPSRCAKRLLAVSWYADLVEGERHGPAHTAVTSTGIPEKRGIPIRGSTPAVAEVSRLTPGTPQAWGSDTTPDRIAAVIPTEASVDPWSEATRTV